MTNVQFVIKGITYRKQRHAKHCLLDVIRLILLWVSVFFVKKITVFQLQAYVQNSV